MTDREALDRLIEAVEAGKNLSWRDFWPVSHDEPAIYARQAYSGSLDAAKALHEDVLPRHYAQVHMWPMPEMARVDIGGGHTGRDDNPARAWLLAILRALREKADD